MEFEYTPIVKLMPVEGDVFVSRTGFMQIADVQACERDLRAYCEHRLGTEIATNVNELHGRISVKGVERPIIEQFLTDCGF